MQRFLQMLLVVLATAWSTVHAESRAPEPDVRGGIIDLSDWSFEQQGTVELNGEWELYWREFLTSADLRRQDTENPRTIEVPGTWNGLIINDQQIGAEGYATYRLNILTSRRDPLALKMPDAGTAIRVIVDGEELLNAGTPGTDEASTTPRYRPAIVQFTPTRGRVEVILHIANFDHRIGGAWLPIILGTPEQLSDLRENQLARDLILFGAILIIGLYNFALFALRPENRSSIYLACFCLLLAIRQLMVGDRFMTRLLPDLPFDWYVRIEYLGWYLAMSAFVGFLNSIFPREVHRWGVRAVHVVFGLASVVTLVTPPLFFTWLVPPLQIVTVLALLWGAYSLVLATIRRRDGARILLVAYAFLFYTSISDILVNAGITGNVLLLDLGLFIFILSQSVLISFRFTNSFKTIERQRTQLEAANLKLRTQEKLRRDAETESESLHKRIVQSEKMEAIGLLAGGVAHDLNNILSTTVTYPELALLDLPKDSPLARPLEMTKQAGLRAAAVIQDLLTLARRGVVQREVLSLNEAVDEYTGSVEHQLMKAQLPGLRIETNLDDSLDNIEGSPVHLQKLLMNLISNAAEAQGGTGTIRVNTHNEHTSKRPLFYMEIEAGDYVVLSVEDEGSGIDADDLDKIFEPFYTTKVMGQSGTGLGMSVIWGVVYDHGGAIDVISRPGVGTRFDVYFPITRKPAPEKPVPEPIADLMGKGERVLIVDDLEEQRALTSAVLTRLGYRPEACTTGEEAVMRLRETQFDLVVLDMVIDDGWDGLATFKALKEVDPDIRTVLVSGFAETDQVTEAQALGAGPFLRKPFTIEQVGARLKQVLRQ